MSCKIQPARYSHQSAGHQMIQQGPKFWHKYIRKPLRHSWYPHIREPKRRIFRVENIDRCGSNWPLGTKMCNLDPEIWILEQGISPVYLGLQLSHLEKISVSKLWVIFWGSPLFLAVWQFKLWTPNRTRIQVAHQFRTGLSFRK